DTIVHEPRHGASRATVILVHGITVDRDEGGMFVRLADHLAAAGHTAIRFSFRGHGNSGGSTTGATIAGEILDLQAVIDHARSMNAGPLVIVAASFGAVPTALTLPYVPDLAALVLWSPVLDLRRTFTEPELPWGKDNFGAEQQQALRREGSLLVDGEWKLGRVLFDEMRLYDPQSPLLTSSVPTLAVHGDRDTYVPYDVTKAVAAQRPGTELHTVAGSGHGFDTREREDEAIAVTVDWVARRFKAER
ncbi:MAG: alpha/beta hydrolase, partial [Pseudonocardiaceae bacterium]